MAVDNASGTVTIFKDGGRFLRADDDGLLVRNFPGGRVRRIAWAEISRFADGMATDGKGGVAGWRLLIVLRTGKQVGVVCSGKLPGEVVAAVRQVAQPHGIPADLSAVPTTKDGRPANRGLYQDPGGRAGLRYWDGTQWSPLLPPEFGERSSRTVRKGPGFWWALLTADRRWTVRTSPRSWSALPREDGLWTYAAKAAMYWMVLVAVAAAASAALLAGGMARVLWLDRGPHHGHISSVAFWWGGGLTALVAFGSWRNWKFFRRLDEAVKRALGIWS